MVEGFGFQTKTLDLHIGPERMCVEEIRVRGPGCATQPEIADPESRAWAYEVPQGQQNYAIGKTCFRPERWDCDLGDRKDISGDGAGRRAESFGKTLITTWVVFII